jgi:hypothetical protein
MMSEFKEVFSTAKGSDQFYKFLQVVFNLYPEDKFLALISETTKRLDSDEAIYKEVQQKLPSISPFLSDLRYSLPALKKQKREMTRQTMELLENKKTINGYVEIGSTGRYYSGLRKAMRISGKCYMVNDIAPSNSIADIMERGQIAKVGEFIPLDYSPLRRITDSSVDLVICNIGLHHAPLDKLEGFVRSIHHILRPGGSFIMRDHDVKTREMATFCSLVHTVFNLGTKVDWRTNADEFKSFRPIEEWSTYVSALGFTDAGKRLLQENDPSDNTLIRLIKV